MDKRNENGGFRYTYSASEQEELRRIRERYTAPTETENKMERLRRLDAGVAAKAQAVSLIFGVIGTLILGLGMSNAEFFGHMICGINILKEKVVFIGFDLLCVVSADLINSTGCNTANRNAGIHQFFFCIA